MKKIISFVFATLATFALASLAQAQPYVDDGSGICYNKSISTPSTEGIYTITLESFVTGSVSVTNESVPADIVLVLDVSGSMTGTIDTYSYSGTSKNWTYNNRGNETLYFLHTDGKYYEISFNHNNNGSRVTFTVGGTTWYLTANGATTTRPNRVGDNATFFNGTLYTATLISSVSKIDALKAAVGTFIDEIQQNDLYDKNGDLRKKDGVPTPLGNQISIVKFAMNRYYNSNADYDDNNAPLAEGDHDYAYSTTLQDANYTEVVKSFTPTGTQANVTSLKNAVNSLHAAGATAADYGMNLARLLLAGLPTTGENSRANSAKTIVFFTDGSPTHGNSFDNTVATHAIANSYTIKNSGSAANRPLVFSIGVFDSKPTTGSNISNFMNYISSNYPNATAYNVGGTQASDKYYIDASEGEADLEEIFKTVAQQSGGSDYDLSESTVSQVDVVSASFTLPEGADESFIHVYTAECNGVDDDGYLTFADRVEVDDEDLDVDDDIEVTLTESIEGSNKKDRITVNGFNYGDNFCGPTKVDGQITGYQGYKVIITIPILMDESAVGGPDVATNAPGSGIYVNDQPRPIVEFVSPKVSLPVNLHINKQGLDEGESAKFTIQRKYVKDEDAQNGNNAWEPITSVFVTRRKGQDIAAPITKVMGMPSTDANDKPYMYRIVEDDWSWSYNSTAVTGTTTEELELNPFIFTNTKKTGIDYKVRHAESKATNTFHPDKKQVDYDDSKQNVRTSSTQTGGEGNTEQNGNGDENTNQNGN